MQILGTNERDYLQDRIGSDDFVFGFAGPDELEDDLRMTGQQPSDDYFYGGTGHDSIFSILGSDHIFGQRGNDDLDVMKGGDKRVVVHGGRGHDTMTLWDFDEDRVDIKVHDRRTVVEQGGNKIVIHHDVEEWHFF